MTPREPLFNTPAHTLYTYTLLVHSLHLFCGVRYTLHSPFVSVCFSAGRIRAHEIEHFSCWFAVKWCACVGLRRVSFSIEPNIAMTEGDGRRDEEKRGRGEERRGEERRGEERRGEEVWSTYSSFCCSSLLDSQSTVQFGQSLQWRQTHMETQTVPTCVHICTQALSYKCMLTHTCRLCTKWSTGRREGHES